jgi:hypothetical protein
MAHEDRRVPFENMIYVADGPSDIPVFSILNHYGGKTYAVYASQNRAEFIQVRGLQEQGRVQGIGETDYREGTHTDMWISTSIEQIAERIVRKREEALGDRVGVPPRHIIERQQAVAAVPPSDRPLETSPNPTLAAVLTPEDSRGEDTPVAKEGGGGAA